MIPTLKLKCENDHEWSVYVPWYSFRPACPDCNKLANSIQWGGFQEIGKKSEQEKPEALQAK